MTVPPYARWSAYALAAVLTLAAAAWLGDDAADGVVLPSPRAAAPAAAGRALAGRGDAAAPALALPLPRQAQEPTSDPFAVVDAVAEPGSSGVAARVLPSAPARPSAPALPFVYLGSWKENGKTSILVQRDDRAYRIAGPGPLDAEYTVRSVDEQRITLNYLPLGIVQELRFDAPAVAPAVASAPVTVQSTSEPESQGEN